MVFGVFTDTGLVSDTPDSADTVKNGMKHFQCISRDIRLCVCFCHRLHSLGITKHSRILRADALSGGPPPFSPPPLFSVLVAMSVCVCVCPKSATFSFAILERAGDF